MASFSYRLCMCVLLALPVAGYLRGLPDGNANKGPRLIDLRRETTPVTRGGKVVSFKSSYSGDFKLGSSSPTFRVVFDTGSGHVVLPSSSCESEACLKHKRYNVSASAQAQAVNLDGSLASDATGIDTLKIGYGTGEVHGELVRDKACVGMGNDELCLEMTAVMAVSLSPVPFGQLNFDGIVGMGLPALTVHKDCSFFDKLVRSQQISQTQFSFFLSDEEDGSELALGGYNRKHLMRPNEDLMWAKVTDSGHWQVEIRGIYIGGNRVDMCNPEDKCHGIVDTGTSHFGVPGSNFQEIEDLLTAQAGELLDCRLAQAPEVQVEMAGFNLTINPKNYMRRLPIREDVQVGTRSALSQENGSDTAASSGMAGEDEDSEEISEAVVPRWCRPRLLPVRVGPPLGPNLFMLGEPLLKQYYTVFDWTGPRVGFGESTYSMQEVAVGPHGVGELPKDADVYLMQQMLATGRRPSASGGEDEVFMMQVTVAVTVRRGRVASRAVDV